MFFFRGSDGPKKWIIRQWPGQTHAGLVRHEGKEEVCYCVLMFLFRSGKEDSDRAVEKAPWATSGLIHTRKVGGYQRSKQCLACLQALSIQFSSLAMHTRTCPLASKLPFYLVRLQVSQFHVSQLTSLSDISRKPVDRIYSNLEVKMKEPKIAALGAKQADIGADEVDRKKPCYGVWRYARENEVGTKGGIEERRQLHTFLLYRLKPEGKGPWTRPERLGTHCPDTLC